MLKYISLHRVKRISLHPLRTASSIISHSTLAISLHLTLLHGVSLCVDSEHNEQLVSLLAGLDEDCDGPAEHGGYLYDSIAVLWCAMVGYGGLWWAMLYL